MRAGRLRQRVTIEDLIVDQDSEDGERTETWLDIVGWMVPAEIMPLSGRELTASAAVQSKIAVRIKIRHRPGVSANMRVLHRGTAYSIEAVTTDSDSGVDYMTLHCSNGIAQG